MNEKELRLTILILAVELMEECWRLAKENPVSRERILTEALKNMLGREMDGGRNDQ